MKLYANPFTYSSSLHAVLKDFIWLGFSSKQEAGKLMRFQCSENHLCAYHNHSYMYTDNVFLVVRFPTSWGLTFNFLRLECSCRKAAKTKLSFLFPAAAGTLLRRKNFLHMHYFWAVLYINTCNINLILKKLSRKEYSGIYTINDTTQWFPGRLPHLWILLDVHMDIQWKWLLRSGCQSHTLKAHCKALWLYY